MKEIEFSDVRQGDRVRATGTSAGGSVVEGVVTTLGGGWFSVNEWATVENTAGVRLELLERPFEFKHGTIIGDPSRPGSRLVYVVEAGISAVNEGLWLGFVFDGAAQGLATDTGGRLIADLKKSLGERGSGWFTTPSAKWLIDECGWVVIESEGERP